MKKIILSLTVAFGIAGTAVYAAPRFGAQTLQATVTECGIAFQGPLYDTPSGHMEKGYYDVATGRTFSQINGDKTTDELKPANLIGGQGAWKECTDKNGYTHEIQITNAEYSGYKTAPIPTATVMATST